MIIGILLILFATPSFDTTATAADSLASTSTYYTIRSDMRRCAPPACGGYFIKLVNQPRTRCADRRLMTECYVASINWNGQPKPERDGVVVRGTLGSHTNKHGTHGVLNAQEVWTPAGTNQPTGTFFRVRDRGIRCIAAPCETHHEAKLNTSVSRNVAGVDISGAGAADNVTSDAFQAMTSQEGILVVGANSPVTGPAGRSQTLKATQFYLRAQASASNPAPPNQTPKPCFKTGCSGQVCADEEVMTTCEYKAEYACYKRAKCERQASGQCGFTDTPELRRCLRRN